MKVLRTPDGRFAGLPDFAFAPHYAHVTGSAGTALRLHYLDEGPTDAAPVLLMHGEPTWSYLYRHMIPPILAQGHRVVAPDLIGFGRSDKPADRADYSYQRHVDWMADWLEQMDLTGITLFCQDWGGLIGLRLLAMMPDRFARLVVANTALPTGDAPMNDAFRAWRDYSQTTPVFNAGRIVSGGTSTKLTPDEVAAYDAPFPDESFQSGARIFPMLVPMTPDDPAAAANRAAWARLALLDLPVLTLFGRDDRIMAGIDRQFQKHMPGAAGQPHRRIGGAAHFLQEDAGPALAAAVTDFIDAT